MTFPYKTIKKENINCNFCGGNDYKILSNKGTDGLDLTSVICKKCALIYINPRMTKDGYKQYYENEYREKSINNGDTGSGFDCRKLFDTTQVHGRALADFIKPHLKVQGPIMEIGSGVGGVLAGIKQILNREVVGLEPSGNEAEYANSQGINTYHELIEEHTKQEKCAVILSTQALNHYLDPKYFFKWAHESLVKDGIIVVEVMNFRQQLKKAGKYENSVKIDHVYMFTPTLLKDFVRSAGFEILEYDVDEFTKKKIRQGIPHVHIRIIARKLPVKPFEKLIITPHNYIKTLLSINKYIIYLQYFIFIRLPKSFKFLFRFS